MTTGKQLTCSFRQIYINNTFVGEGKTQKRICCAYRPLIMNDNLPGCVF